MESSDSNRAAGYSHRNPQGFRTSREGLGQPKVALTHAKAPPGRTSDENDERATYFLQVSSPISEKPLPMSISSLWKPSFGLFIPIVSRVFSFIPIIQPSPV